MSLATWARLAWPVNPGAFRLFLALLVFVHHCSSFGFGKYAVYVFFVLSGYWVHRMWIVRYSTAHDPYLTFIVSRIWRLAPAFMLANVSAVALMLLIGTSPEALFASGAPHLLFSSVFVLGYAWLPDLPVMPGWSLDVEIQYYLVAPLLVLLARRMAVGSLLLAAALASYAASTLAGPPTLPAYLFFFCGGLAAAEVGWRPSKRLAGWSVAAVTVAVVLVSAGPLHGVLFGGAHPGPLFVWNPAFNVAMAALSIPFAIYTTGQPSDAPDRAMADLSYMVYILHGSAMHGLAAVSGSYPLRLACTVLAWGVVLALSWLVWRYVDRPINAARSRWVSARVRAGRVGGRRDVARA